MKFLATLTVWFQNFCEIFSDDESYDSSWMDAEKWSMTRGV